MQCMARKTRTGPPFSLGAHCGQIEPVKAGERHLGRQSAHGKWHVLPIPALNNDTHERERKGGFYFLI